MLPRHHLDPGRGRHDEHQRQGPGGRRLREDELEHEADERELHHHARGSDGDAAFEPQAEAPGDRRVDREQARRKGKIEGR